MSQDVAQIIRDFSQLTGNQFLEKYPQVDKEAYWDVGGEGLIQALAGYRKQPALLTEAEIKAKLEEIQPEGFNWTDITDSEMVKFKAIAQAQRDKAL